MPPMPSKNKTSVGALAMSATSFGLNIIQELNEPPVFEMRFVQLSPNNKVPYKYDNIRIIIVIKNFLLF